ncbi:MAG: secondary thiamine-phosphate synthase enzyme YjbQ [Dehalococcoidia bacterium]
MPVHSAQIRISTEGHGDVIDITRGVQEVVNTSGARDGVVNVFVAHSTAAIALIENETGAVLDLKELMDRLVPPDDNYNHNRTAGDTNAHSHLQAAVIGPSEAVPLKDGQLQTGTWQQFVLVDFDDSARERRVMVQVVS